MVILYSYILVKVAVNCLYVFFQNRQQSLQHSVSETPLQKTVMQVTDDPLPPPPPPAFSVDPVREKPRVLQDIRDETLLTGTSQSTMSAASATLTSNTSFRSSQTDDSEDDGRKRV